MLASYLARLGVEAEPPSVDALFRLHRAHVERVPYETVWIHLGEPWSIDTTESAARISSRRRGGYCYHLNGAFSELLRALGYHVTRHVGGVHGPTGASEGEMRNHLVLEVHDLPDDCSPSGTWYVDAGLGDAMHEPLPLVAGEYQQGPYTLVLTETPDGIGDWHLDHDATRGSFAGMAWRATAVDIDAFTERHAWLSTSPESGFVKVLTVQRRDGTGADILRGLDLRRVGDSAMARDLATKAELVDALTDVFGLDVSDIAPERIDALWAKLDVAHERWVAKGRL